MSVNFNNFIDGGDSVLNQAIKNGINVEFIRDMLETKLPKITRINGIKQTAFHICIRELE